MISLLILIVLAWSFYIGYSRGLIVQAFYTFSSIFAMIVAAGLYKKVADVLYLWVPFANATEGSTSYFFDSQYLFDLDQIFYAGLGFLLVYFLVYVIMRLLGIFVHLLTFADPDTATSKLIAGGLAVLVTWISLQMVLTIAATVPLALIQDNLSKDILSKVMIDFTPITSAVFKNLWIGAISAQ
ncbi:CvpA family protein [Streptococcus suis]|nr:CvpA family protein [Streptococcus suis]